MYLVYKGTTCVLTNQPIVNCSRHDKTDTFITLSYLRCLCLFGCSCVRHILCCVFVLFFFVLLPFSQDYPFLITPSVFSKVYLHFTSTWVHPRVLVESVLLIILVFCDILCFHVFVVFVLCLVCPFLLVSLYCPFLIALSFWFL